MAFIDPTSIAGLQVWVDAASVTLNGSDIATMDNQETTAVEDMDQQTAANQPLQVTIAGIKGAQFDGVNEILHSLGPVSLDTTGTIVVAMKLPATGAGIQSMFHGDHDGQPSTAFVVGSIGGQLYAGRSAFSGGAVLISPDAFWAWGTEVILTVYWDASDNSATVRVNRANRGSGTGSAFDGVNGWSMGALPNATLPSDLTVYGFVQYDSVLTGDQIDDIESYMGSTYSPLLPPTANAGPDQIVYITDESGLASVTLDGSASTDSNGTIDSYGWYLGGQELITGPSSTAIVSLPEGVHTIRMWIQDDSLQWSTNTVLITVKPKIRTYLHVPDATAVTYTLPFPLTAVEQSPLSDQVRIFRKSGAVVTELIPVGRKDQLPTDLTDFTVTSTTVVLNVAFPGDELVILRETQMNKPFVRMTATARVRSADRNLQGDQILYVAQELRETRDIADLLGSASGEAFEYSALTLDTGNWTSTHQGDGVVTAFAYDSIQLLPVQAVKHTSSLVVLLDGVQQLSGFTVDESTLSITFTVAPATGVLVQIRRQTRIDKRWVTHTDASSFSSLIDIWDRLNLKFIIEETVGFPTFLLGNALNNRIHPRVINTVTYSGPGDRFFFGNLPWFGDGTISVFDNGLPVSGQDFVIDFNFFTINFNPSLTGPVQISTTTPGYAFGALPFDDGSLGNSTLTEDEAAAAANPPPAPPGTASIPLREGSDWNPITYFTSPGLDGRDVVTGGGGGMVIHNSSAYSSSPIRNVLSTVIMTVDLSAHSVSGTVNSASITFTQSLWGLTGIGLPFGSFVGRIPVSSLSGGDIANLKPSFDNSFQFEAAPDGPSVPWTNTDGGRQDVTQSVPIPWGTGGGGGGTSNWTVFGLEGLIQAALNAGETTMILIFYGPGVDPRPGPPATTVERASVALNQLSGSDAGTLDITFTP